MLAMGDRFVPEKSLKVIASCITPLDTFCLFLSVDAL